MAGVGPRSDLKDIWPNEKDFATCNRFMLDKNIDCDVWFLVGPNKQRIGSHKYMLAARSYQFHLMFNGPQAQEAGSTILIPDIDPGIFEKLLLYIYCNNDVVQPNDAVRLWQAAEKFGFQGLLEKCRQSLYEEMSVNSVCKILQMAVDNDNLPLKAECISYIKYDTENVLKSNGFLRLSHKGLVELLREHQLNVSEEVIFHYVLEWAKRSCDHKSKQKTPQNLRHELKRAVLENIYFPHMVEEHFTKISEMGILTDKECVEIMRFYMSQRAVPPEIPHQRSIVFNRFRNHLSGKGYKWGNEDRIRFSVSEELKLKEVFIYGSCQNPGQYKIDMKIFDGSKSLYHRKFEIDTDGCFRFYPIAVDPPVQVQKDKVYSLRMLMIGPPSFYGNGGCSELFSDGVTMKLDTDIDGLNGTSTNIGQFPGFAFSRN